MLLFEGGVVQWDGIVEWYRGVVQWGGKVEWYSGVVQWVVKWGGKVG